MNIVAKIKQEDCLGCGVCVVMVPSVFNIGINGKAEVIGKITMENAEDVKAAAEDCPAQVITIEG